MNRLIILLLATAVTLPAIAQVAAVQGRDVEAKLKGNTARVYNVGCDDDLPNAVYYFRDNGTVTARLRPCNLPVDRVQTQNGRWRIEGGRFCIRELASVDNFCFGLKELTDRTYRLVFFNSVMRQAWTVVVIDEGNSFNLE